MHAQGSPLVKIFVTEGLFYFILIASFNVLNTIFMFQSNMSIQNINSILALIILQVLCCRLVLTLHWRSRTGGASADPVQVSANTKGTMPVFAHPGATWGPVDTRFETVNIPLEHFNRPDDESYDHGMKFHVSVEREVEVGN
ncbi:hypothetical protein BC628DRAFT_1395934 [Trametes gibbosa]|nr:hypothetical protein BC628DRAFT_1395934 [Trametes gibbosa]